MANVFNMELRPQQEWSWLLAIWLFLGGTGSGLFLLFFAFELPALYGALSLGLIMSGGIVLLLELGNPARVWRTLLRPGSSWLSRGVFFVLIFIASSAAVIGAKSGMVAWLTPLADTMTIKLLGWVAGLCALMIVLYPAFFVLSTSRAIPFWNTPLLPLLFVGYAVLGGAGVVLLLTSFSKAPPQIEPLAMTLILINAAMILVYLATMYRAGRSAQESVRLLNHSSLGVTFWVGVVIAGMVLPLLEMLVMRWSIPAAGGLILVGSLLFRYCLLKAGVYIAPALVEVDFDLKMLNRTSTEFEREYAGMGTQSAGRSR
ncbi:MAG: polysulfide reductase NrfD [Hyphomicrobiales bacterium]|nr:polysulfide reductase NrfD [Hyphomicrobiales bacterium]